MESDKAQQKFFNCTRYIKPTLLLMVRIFETFVKIKFPQLQGLVETSRSILVNFVKIESWIFAILLICEILVPWIKGCGMLPSSFCWDFYSFSLLGKIQCVLKLERVVCVIIVCLLWSNHGRVHPQQIYVS